MHVTDDMEILIKLFACYVLLVCLNSETAGKECIDKWPFCHMYIHLCHNQTDQRMDIHDQCPKQCGLCASSVNDSQSDDVTCRDKLDCSPFNLIEGCQSNNTWYREHCRNSCNMCLSENESTTEGCIICDEDSTGKVGVVSGTDRWEDDKKVIISVNGSLVFIIVVGNVIVYFTFVKNRKGLNDTHTHEEQKEHDQSHSDVQIPDNAEIESCSEPNIHVYHEIGDTIYDTACREQTRWSNKTKILIIENVPGHSEDVMYLHPINQSVYYFCKRIPE